MNLAKLSTISEKGIRNYIHSQSANFESANFVCIASIWD